MIYDTFDAFRIYRGIKFHFNGKYDCQKYNYITYKDIDVFKKDNAKAIYKSLATKYKSDYPFFIAVCFSRNRKLSWVGECMDYEHVFVEVDKYMQSVTRFFGEEIDTLLLVAENNNVKFPHLLKSNNNKIPALQNLYDEGLISLETCVILDRMVGFTSKIDLKENRSYLSFKNRLLNYRPFVKIDVKKCKKIVIKKLEKIYEL
jgi:hypothetical protein